MYQQIIIYYIITGLQVAHYTKEKKINEQLSKEICVHVGGKVTKQQPPFWPSVYRAWQFTYSVFAKEHYYFY